MKKILTITAAILVSTCGIAKASTSPSAGLQKNSKQMNALNSAWRTHHTIKTTQDNKIEMVYGGEDVTTPAIIVPRTAAA